MTRFVRQPLTDLTVDLSTPIWRYQNLDKLLWTLAKGCLWFARADTLGDAYEGSHLRSFIDGLTFHIANSANEAAAAEFRGKFRTAGKGLVQNTAINCWHMSEYESAAMWDLYVRLGQGIAIRSDPPHRTIGRTLHLITRRCPFRWEVFN